MTERSDWSKRGLADLHRQGFMKPRTVRVKREPLPREGCALCMDWHEKGKHRRVVWAVDLSDKPIGEGRSFVDLKSASEFAQQQAIRSSSDQVVSVGYNVSDSGFKIVRRYRAGSGDKVLG